MSARRSTARSGATISVPAVVVDKYNQAKSYLWDKTCPFGSFYMWLMVLLGLYYLFFLPTTSVKVSGNTAQVIQVTTALRGFLFLATLVSGVVGYYIIKRGCATAGSWWAVLWFLISLFVSGVIITLILAASQKISLPNAASLLQQINQGK